MGMNRLLLCSSYSGVTFLFLRIRFSFFFFSFSSSTIDVDNFQNKSNRNMAKEKLRQMFSWEAKQEKQVGPASIDDLNTDPEFESYEL
jgi:hypothetical protein